MDASQITGACSSYARKYALNGLLAIDDTKDSDATNKHDDSNQPTIKASTIATAYAIPFPLLAKGETKWLNDNTTEYSTIKALVEKGVTLTEVRKYFSVSKKIADKLIESVKTIG
jgi:hypothetical protein